MLARNILKQLGLEVPASPANAPIAGGTSDVVVSVAKEMHESITLFIMLGAVTTNAGNVVTLQAGSDGSSFSNVNDSSGNVWSVSYAGSNSNKLVAIEVPKHPANYLQFTIKRGASVAISGIFFAKGNGRYVPESLGTGVAVQTQILTDQLP